MTTKNAERVQEVFSAAVECPSNRRKGLLDELCGADAELRSEVESLLAHDDTDAPDDFMQPPQPAITSLRESPTDKPDPRVGQRIGRYLIKQVIASGGMGTVYLAEQEQPSRDVALKVIRPEFASQSGLRRFEFESEFLAKLDHSNIAHVYEAGVHEEQGLAGPVWVPFFAMQYVEGARPITVYSTENGLTLTDRLRLFMQVCDAVHHGHQKGVIHRDLKPANILVDGAGQVKIIDFGVARAADGQVAVTTVGSGMSAMIGTPEYMSPEQCMGDAADVDVRSDVYSLGVVLYELLCGRKPYDFGTVFQAIKVICETEPTAPSSVNRTLRGDLEAIVLAALVKDPAKRYQSAREFTADIGRFLSGEPISVRPPTRWTRVLHWAGRHPIATTGGLAAIVGGAVIFGAFALAWLALTRPNELAFSWREDSEFDSVTEVRLLSLGNRLLQSWRAEPDEAIRFIHPELIPRPKELGGGRLVVLGHSKNTDPAISGAVVAYDVTKDYDSHEWSRRIEPGDPVPQSLTPGIDRENDPAGFTCYFGDLFDVFPESPGPEIIAAYGCRYYSQHILRIYNLAGDLLYEIWHDGNISGAYWMEDAGLLVLRAHNGVWTRRELGLCQSDDQASGCLSHPMVVFAIRPQLDRINRDTCIGTQQSLEGTDVRWYLIIDPGGHNLTVSPPWKGDASRSVGLSVTITSPVKGNFNLDLDSDGREIESSRQRANSYLANQDKLPDFNEFKLVPFAEVLKKAGKLDPQAAENETP